MLPGRHLPGAGEAGRRDAGHEWQPFEREAAADGSGEQVLLQGDVGGREADVAAPRDGERGRAQGQRAGGEAGVRGGDPVEEWEAAERGWGDQLGEVRVRGEELRRCAGPVQEGVAAVPRGSGRGAGCDRGVPLLPGEFGEGEASVRAGFTVESGVRRGEHWNGGD